MGLGTGTNRLCGTGWDHDRQVRDGRHRDFICILAKANTYCRPKYMQPEDKYSNHHYWKKSIACLPFSKQPIESRVLINTNSRYTIASRSSYSFEKKTGEFDSDNIRFLERIDYVGHNSDAESVTSTGMVFSEMYPRVVPLNSGDEP